VATKRTIDNPLALAVMAVLSERPMHPYQISTLLKERRKHDSIRLNYGSLYSVVDALQREGMIVPYETVREGKRPERTVYALTTAGEAELFRWLRELIATPVKEYPQFAAGLSLIARLSKEEAIVLLEKRAEQLEREIDLARVEIEAAIRGDFGFPLPRLFLIENEYELSQREAELAWVRRVATELADGTLPWPGYRVQDGRQFIVMPDSEEIEVVGEQ
jgi:DNA-binding PadR family transcriptional regulator